MSDTVQKIKEKLSIVDVVQSYVKLTKAGKYWKGLSPFNKEKTPSFYVSPDRGLYHCFSSGKGGDMFTFVEEMEGVDFRGALAILAERAGVELVSEPVGARDERERLYAALEEARRLFVDALTHTRDAHAYLIERGLSETTIRDWGVGYAMKEWRALKEALVEKKYTEHELLRAGLVKRPDVEDGSTDTEAKSYDRFRGRIMFPIFDLSGRVTAFSGRIFEDDPTHPQAKYLNSPEGPVFDKSRTLYGLDRARDTIRSLNAAILVEGQFDLIMAHQIGYKNAVATSGTAFTIEHANLLKRYSENLLIAYDGDRAGVMAAGRAAQISLSLGMNVKIAKLPIGKDPADLIRDDAPTFKSVIKGALHVVDFYLAHIADAKYDARRHRLEVSRVVIPYVAMIENKIDQAHFTKRVAESLGVDEDAVRAEVGKVAKGTPVIEESIVPRVPFMSRGDTLERLTFGLYRVFTEAGESENAERAKGALMDTIGNERFEALEKSSPDSERAMMFEADLFLERNSEPELRAQAVAETYAELKKESYHERYRDAVRSLRDAEVAHDDNRADTLMQELANLAKHLK